jgi:hypothetical protein
MYLAFVGRKFLRGAKAHIWGAAVTRRPPRCRGLRVGEEARGDVEAAGAGAADGGGAELASQGS